MPNSCYLGIDIGGTNIKILACDRGGELCFKTTHTTAHISDMPEFANYIFDVVTQDLLDRNMLQALKGICLALPGQVDTANNKALKINALGWKCCKYDLAGHISKCFNVPTLLMNDGNAHLLGECRKGAAAGQKNVILLSLGTGVGGAVLINGQLLEGECGLAGELGHMIVEANGEKCHCGNSGCLQSYCSARSILEYTTRIIPGYPDSRLNALIAENSGKMELPLLNRGALEGDELCNLIWARVGRYLGVAAVSLINIFNPSLILVGGGISGAGALIMDPAKEYIRRHLALPLQLCRLEQARLGEFAGAWGACYKIIEAETL